MAAGLRGTMGRMKSLLVVLGVLGVLAVLFVAFLSGVAPIPVDSSSGPRVDLASALLEALADEDRLAFAALPCVGNEHVDVVYETCLEAVEDVDLSEPPLSIREQDELTVIADFAHGWSVIVPIVENDGVLAFVPQLRTQLATRVTPAAGEDLSLLEMADMSLTKYKQLEAKLETKLPKDVGVNAAVGPKLTLGLRPGPTVAMPDGAVLDLAAFGEHARSASEAWQGHRVVLDVGEGLTYPEVVKVVDRLLMANVTDIVFAGVELQEQGDGD